MIKAGKDRKELQKQRNGKMMQEQSEACRLTTHTIKKPASHSFQKEAK